MSTTDKVSERRRYKRYGVNLGAIVAFEGAMPYVMEEPFTLKCNILDFCTHGLFLEIHKSFMDLSQLLNRQAKVLFPVISEHSKRYARVDAQVVRISPNGIGVTFEKISESVFRALMRKSRNQQQAETREKTVRLDGVSLQEPFKLSVGRLIDEQMPFIMDGFFKQARRDLELGAGNAQHFREETSYLDAIRDLRFYQTAISQKFCRSVGRHIDFVRHSEPEQNQSGSEGLSLSLIDKDDFEEWLNLSISTKKVAAQLNTQLTQIDLKLGYVANIPAHDLNNPFNPANLFNSFKESIASIEGFSGVKHTLYKAFESALLSRLPEFYLLLEELLGAYGCPGKIEAAQDPKPNKLERFTPQAISTQSDTRKDFSQDIPLQPTVVYDIAEHHLIDSAVEIANRAKQGQSLLLTATKLLDLLSERKTHEALAAGQASSRDDKHYAVAQAFYSRNEIIEAIPRLQIRSSSHPASVQDQVNLCARLADLLAADAEKTRQISQLDRDRLNISEQLLETLTQELVFAPCIKSYLDIIQLPLIALALVDSSFLESPDHPARHVVNQLFELESAIRVNRIVQNHNIRETLDRLFGRIVLESTGNPAIFAWANEELKSLTQALSRSRAVNTRRLVEACEGRQKLEQARQRGQNEIDRRFAGKKIPSVILSMLDLGWQHLLVMAELQDSEGLQYRQKLLKTLDDLVLWLGYQGNFIDEQKQAIRQCLVYIEEQLARPGSNRYLVDSVIDELKASLLGTGTPSVRKSVTLVSMAAAITAATQTTPKVLAHWLRRVDSLHVGEWFSVASEGGDIEPQQLLWIGNQPKLYVFVNRDGHKRQELSRLRVAELLAEGLIRSIDNLNESPMDRAIGKMLQSWHDKLIANASFDQVTQTFNRREFVKRLRQEWLQTTSDDQQMLGYLEILDYRMINNVCGAKAGDELLRMIAQLLKNQLRQEACVGRLGDQNFGFLIRQSTVESSLKVALNLRDLINQSHFKWADKSYSIGVSIGLASLSDQRYGVDELLQQADTASIAAKRSGHNRIRLYQDDDAAIKAQADLHEWAGRINRILAEKRLFPRCQKIAPITTGKQAHSHYEILLGIKDEDGKIITPGDFLPAVEHCQRMPEIDFWVADTVFAWIEENKAFFDQIGGFAINLSGQSLNSEEFLHRLVKRMKSSQLPFNKITFEVTETVAAENMAFTEAFIESVKKFGCKFSLDDFGTGYSSYSYLKNLDVDYLKIDGSFIKEIADNPTDLAIVRSMNEIAHSLGLETIAEYVENEVVYDVLKGIGVDYGQGWSIHKPTVLSELLH